MRIHAAALALTAALVPFSAYAQDPPAAPPDAQAQDAGGGRGGRAPEPQMRPYDRVITKDAKSDEGIFTVHRIKDRLYYEIPRTSSGKEFLWVSQIQDDARRRLRRQAAGNRVVRWERRGDRVLLRSVSYEVVADAVDADRAGGAGGELRPILMAFNIEALGKDDAPVIEVTRLFTTDVPEFSGRTRVRAAPSTRRARSSSAPSRSRRTSRSKRPTPTTIRRTRRRPAADRRPCRQDAAPRPRAPAAPASSCTTAWCKLPEKPMSRGCSTSASATSPSGTMDYGRDEHRAPERALHHALAPGEEGSERRALRAGEADRLLHRSGDADEVGAVHEEGHRDWQPAFEAAGFKNAIIAKEAPTPRTGSGLEPGGRALLGDPLAAVDDRERRRARTSTIRAPARSSRRTSSSTTTS